MVNPVRMPDWALVDKETIDRAEMHPLLNAYFTSRLRNDEIPSQPNPYPLEFVDGEEEKTRLALDSCPDDPSRYGTLLELRRLYLIDNGLSIHLDGLYYDHMNR